MGRKHIIIMDGTKSRLEAGEETNAGILYKLLKETGDKSIATLHYDEGIQGHGFWNWVTIASGWGINEAIRTAFDRLSTKYQEGDKIYLFGYSRGAYAVRSVAGMMAQIGLVRTSCATERNLRQAFRLYENEANPKLIKAFCDAHCHMNVEIEMIGVWDAVKALGIEYPLLSRLAPMATEFHNDNISPIVRNGFHALALDETRSAYSPVLWKAAPSWNGEMEQVWFKGAHADVGGHVWAKPAARELSNIPLVWMLKRVAMCGLKLPTNWQKRFKTNANAPKIGDRRGIAKFFLIRSRRIPGKFTNEFIHVTAKEHYKGDLNIPISKD